MMDLDTSLAEMVDRNARVRPSHPAILHGEAVLTHRDFAARVGATAAHLATLGVGAGTVLGIALGTRPEHLIAFFAAARLGAIALPLDEKWTAGEKDRVTAAFNAALVLVEPGDPAPPSRGMAVTVDKDWNDAVAAAVPPPPAHDLDAPYLVALSSGTTSTPSGPTVTQRQLIQRFTAQWVSLTLNGRDRFLPATPLYFGATRAFCLSSLYAGATVVLAAPPFTAERIPGQVERYRATAAFLVPTLLRRLLEAPAEVTAPMQRLRVLASSGAALSAEDRAAVRDRLCPNLFNYYGSTEGGGISILGPEEADAPAGTVGRPIFGVEVDIVDAAGRTVPRGEAGRVRYRGNGVAGQAEDGWFYPGDLGRLDAHGYLFLLGRDKELILRGGANIYPAEVEQAIAALPGVAEVAVVGWPSRDLGEEIAAFVVGDSVTEIEILEACREYLAKAKRPRRIFLVDDLPRNSSGKVLKAELRDRLPPL